VASFRIIAQHCERNLQIMRLEKGVKRVAGFAEAIDPYYDEKSGRQE
jgi:hypothetical protein